MDVCRLCLDLVATQGEAKLLDGETRDMVQVVAPELNLEASKEPRACAECQRTLAHLFEFKSRVFEREGEVRSAVGPRCGQLSLKEALEGGAPAATNPGGGDGSTPAKAKDRVCRTCLTPIECESFTVLRPSEPDAYLSSMLDVCLVEVDLELTRDPVMCETCLEQLQRLHHFRSTCQDVEEKIVEFREGDGSAMDHVDLHAVLGAATPATPDVEMVTVKEEDEEGASSSGVVHRRGGRKRVRVEPVKAEPVKEEEEEDDESEEEDDEDEDMSEGEEDLDKALKQEELDIKSETGTSDSDKKMEVIAKRLAFVKLWRDLGVDYVPNYLRDLLLWHDIDNYHALAALGKGDFEKMEEFAKSELPKYLSDDEKKDFYEIYYKHIPMFRIRLGHVKLLEYVIDKARTHLENLGRKTKRSSLSQNNNNKKQKSSDSDENGKAKKVMTHLRI